MNKLDRDMLINTHNDVRHIRRTLTGNGKPGLVDEVIENTKYRIADEAKNKMVGYAVGSGWFITMILLIWQFAQKWIGG